jgi:seryl-tRNA synthetase
MTTKDSEKLTRAAEELIKAASSHIDSAIIDLGRQAVQGLKELSDKTSSVESSLKSLKESHDAKANVVIETIASVKQQLVNLNENVRAQTKNQALTWAIEHASLNSFIYHNKPENNYSYSSNGVQSTEFVRQILFSFRQNMGQYIENRSLT